MQRLFFLWSFNQNHFKTLRVIPLSIHGTDRLAVNGPALRPNASSSTVYRLPKLLTGLFLPLAGEASELLDFEGPHARFETDRSTLELLP